MRILLVDDSALVRSILKEVIHSSATGWKIVGEAANGKEAVRLNIELQPDLIICDLNMPIMDGLSATKEIMNSRPVPILIFSNEVDANNGFQAIKNGAVDVMSKPEISLFNDEAFHLAFFDKLRTVAASNLSPQIFAAKRSGQQAEHTSVGYDMVVIGASTGGPSALAAFLGAMPADFSLGMVLVQHLETGFDKSYVTWLNDQTSLQVKLAQEGDHPQPGELLVAPTDQHLIFSGKQLSLNSSPKVLNQRPSVDLLFESAAKVFGKRLISVLLTGMGRDGAEGSFAVRSSGGVSIVQDEESCTVFGMPKAAIERGAASLICPLGSIAAELSRLAANDER